MGKDERYFKTDHLQKDLGRRSVRGGAATISAQFVRHFVIGLAATAILARLLTPADFGLLAMVAAFTNLLARFKDLGLAMATIQRKEINHDQVSTLFWVNVGLGALMTLLMGALAPLIAWFYGEPRLLTITLALAVALVFGGLTVQHQALLQRQMRFSALAVVQVVAPAVGAIVGIISAFLGAGYWALVIMQLTTTVTMALGIWFVCGWRPGKPVRGADVRSILAFGGNLTGANLLNYLVRNLDNILIGWCWGAGALGLYSRAYALLLLPIRHINGPLTSVAIPALSRLQDDPARYRLYYQKGIQLLVAFGMPLVVFMFVVADKVILLVLGSQWGEAVPIFRMLGPAAFLGTFNVAGSWVLISSGRTDRQLRWMVMSSTVVVVAFLIGLPWGAIGVAGAFSIAQCCLRGPGIIYCYRGTLLRFRDLLEALWRPAFAACTAGGGLFAVNEVLHPLPALWMGILIDLFIYGLFYILCWVITPNGLGVIREMLDMLKALRPQPVDPCQTDE